MSFKLFLQSSFGLIPSTAKLEARDAALWAAYRDFCAFEESDELKKYQELEKLVHSEEFLRKKQELTKLGFKGSKEEAQLRELKQLSKNKKLQKPDAPASPELTRYNELKKITASDDFRKREAYLKAPGKWEKTEEYQKEQAFLELKKSPRLVSYFKYKKGHELDFCRQWDIVFEEKFDKTKLDATKWQTISPIAAQSLDCNYSQPGDLQAFTMGENIKTDGRSLKIETRRESKKGLQWQLPFGFMEKDFNYTSGLVSTGDLFTVSQGIIEAKVQYNPMTNLASVFYLAGKQNIPQIHLVETGVKNRVGIRGASGEEFASISGLRKGAMYIFRLEWNKNSLRWFVNNKELLSTSAITNTDLSLNAATVVVNELTGGLPHQFEIEWVRVYQEKKN